jgi:hypothetical protein
MFAAVPAGCLGTRNEWLGVWSETQAHVGVGMIVALPVAGGLAAWSGYIARTSGLDLLATASSRHALVVVVREQAELCAWIAIGFVAGVIPAYIATAVVPHSGAPRILSVLSQLSWLCATVIVTAWIGRTLPWYLAAPASAAALYFALGLMQYLESGVLHALTPLDDRWMTFHLVAAWVMACQAIMWALVGAAAIAYRAHLARTAWGALWLAGIAAAPLLYVGPTGRVLDPQTTVMSCSQPAGGLSVCLPAAKAYLAPALLRELSRADSLLKGLVPDRVAYVDDEASGTSRAVTREVAAVAQSQTEAGRHVRFLSRFGGGGIFASTQFDVDQLMLGIALDRFPASTIGSGEDAGGQPLATTADALTRWFLEETGVPIDGSAVPGAPILDGRLVTFRGRGVEIAAFAAMTARQRQAWFSRHRADIAKGRLAWSAFDDIPR